MGQSGIDRGKEGRSDMRDQLLKKEAQIATLQNLTAEFSTARDRETVLQITRDKLRSFAIFGHNGLATINDDGCTMTPFLSVKDNASMGHPKYREMLRKKYPLDDGVYDRVLSSPEPLLFHLQEMAAGGEMPEYFQIQWESGISNILAARLFTGNTAIGVWGIALTDEAPVTHEQLSMVKYVSNLIAIAVSNVLASEDIERRQLEKETLLSLSTDIASARTANDLMMLIRLKLYKLLGFTNTGMTSFDKEKMTCTPFVLDPQSTCCSHPHYKQAAAKGYSIYDGLGLEKAFASDRPVVFSLKDLLQRSGTPFYVTIPYESGLKIMCITRLCHGGEVFGFWFLYYDEDKAIEGGTLRLIEGLSNQLSVAVSNILANGDIQRRQLERETLLSLSIDFAAARTTDDLMTIVRLKLKGLLRFTNAGMTLVDKEKMTCAPILSDSQSTASGHPDYARAYKLTYPIYDGLGFERSFNCDKPVVFNLQDIVAEGNVPLYVKIPFESGLKWMCIVRLCHGGEVLGFWMLYYEDGGSIDDSGLRLIEGLSNQLSVAMSNIIANEIIARNLQAVSHQKQQLKEEKSYLMEEIAKSNNSWDMVGKSRAMQAVFQLIKQVAEWDSTVLIQGETGTGKEMIARAIHNSSPRKNKLMVKVNCAALPPNLIESELFGHERGSFTGAIERRIGKFELAHDGTLFLDEVGELPLELQAKLLRALQEKEIERVGGKSPIKVNVRIVAATNRDLEKEMLAGRFRSDLYYRLNIFPIEVPPLRHRKEDIPILAAYFIELHGKKFGRRMQTLNPKVLQELLTYHWPGNIRELENLLERSVLLASGDTIQKINLPPPKVDLVEHGRGEMSVRLQSLADSERQHILSVLKYCGERISGKDGAAVILGIPPSTLISRMKRLGIKKAHVDSK